MKKNIYIILLTLLILSCSKHNDTINIAPAKTTSIKDTGTLSFKIIPLASDELKISFYYSTDRDLIKVFLKKDTSTLGEFAVSNDLNSLYSASVTHDFKTGEKYKIVVQFNSVNDTIYQYTLPEYTQIYQDAFKYQKVLSLKQSLGGTVMIFPHPETLYL